MNIVEIKESKRILSDAYNARYDADFVRRHIELPKNSIDIPNIIGWSGPARSGTSALLFLLAGHPQIDRVYFQPQKTLMRLGQPSIKLYDKDALVCMKEVFYSYDIINTHDPIETLLRAGVPAEKITWIIMLRDPLQTYASWGRQGTNWTPDLFAFWQSFTISLWHKYKDSEVKVVPFVYELLQDQEEYGLKKLLSRVNVDPTLLKLQFDQSMIDKKLVPGQAANEEYFNTNLRKTVGQGRYVYKTNIYPVDPENASRVISLCKEQYDTFYELARRELGIEC